MTSKAIYYCVYRITNLVEKKHYYGYKSSKIHPSKVVGVSYFSSSKDKEFIEDQKQNPQNYKYKIVIIFNTSEEALAREIQLHDRFNVGVNENFYNKAKQTSVGFDTTGRNISTEIRLKMSIDSIGNKNRFFGKKHTIESKNKMKIGSKGKNFGDINCKFEGYYITPFGSFVTRRSIRHSQVCNRSVAKWCKQCHTIINDRSYYASNYLRLNYPVSVIGQTYKDLGFYFENISQIKNFLVP